MKKSANVKLLNDDTVNSNEKLKVSLYIQKQSIIKADALISLSESKSRNDVIEKAIDFYFSYITSQLSQDFLCGVFGSKIEGLFSNLGTRISRGNFRSTVEIDMLTRILATVIRLNKIDYEKIRKKSIQEVKQTNGSIDIMEAIDESESGNLIE